MNTQMLLGQCHYFHKLRQVVALGGMRFFFYTFIYSINYSFLMLNIVIQIQNTSKYNVSIETLKYSIFLFLYQNYLRKP